MKRAYAENGGLADSAIPTTFTIDRWGLRREDLTELVRMNDSGLPFTDIADFLDTLEVED